MANGICCQSTGNTRKLNLNIRRWIVVDNDTGQPLGINSLEQRGSILFTSRKEAREEANYLRQYYGVNGHPICISSFIVSNSR